jgi:NADPH:quinone reductase-like Zn-dependent oxidoreductase
MTMRALCYDPDAHAGLRLADTTEPVPGADEALVAIRAIALNAGEVTGLAERKQSGDVPGWDAAGVVCSLRLTAPGRPPAPG